MIKCEIDGVRINTVSEFKANTIYTRYGTICISNNDTMQYIPPKVK